jgi:twitching motility protein PilT
MLAGALQGVVCQTLLKRVDGEGRIAACEVMVTTSGIKNLIREGKTHQIYSSMQSGGQHGMVTMDQSLANLVRRGLVTRDAALEKAADIQEFERLASGA